MASYMDNFVYVGVQDFASCVMWSCFSFSILLLHASCRAYNFNAS